MLAGCPAPRAPGATSAADRTIELGRAGSVLSGVGAYLSVRFLLRYLRTRTLTPFGVYCLIVGLGSIAFLGLVR